MKEPLLSIIIVSYQNSSLVLRRAIRSVQEQSYQNYEIILVDANAKGSDYSLGLREDMEKFPEIPVITCPCEKGELAAAKNQGAAQAAGVYLAFLMGRDAWNQECAASQIEVLEEHPDVGLVFCHSWTQDEDAFSTRYQYAPDSDGFSPAPGGLLTEETIHSVSQVMIRKSVFESLLGFDTRIRRQDDYDMWLRLSAKNRIAAVDQALVCSYMDRDVLKKSRKLIDVVGYLQLYSKHDSFYKSNPAEKLELYKKIAACYKSEKYFFPWLRYAARLRLLELRVGKKKKRKKPSKEVGHMEPAYSVISQQDREHIAIVLCGGSFAAGAESPEERAEFQIWLKDAGSFEDAKTSERDLLTCNSEGYARSRALTQGVYVVRQTKGREGICLADDFEVTLGCGGVTHTIPVGGQLQEFFVKIIRKDAETGRTVPVAGGAYRIFDEGGKPVRMTVTYPEPAVLDCFCPGAKGYLVTPEKLAYGSYSVREDSAPSGYVRNGREVFFQVSEGHAAEENGIRMIVVEMENTAQKGRILIHKSSPSILKVTASENTQRDLSGRPLGGELLYTPAFEENSMEGAVYEILAEEDVITADGTLRAAKGAVVEELVTDGNGDAMSRELYAGSYQVREKCVPYGMVLGTEPQAAELAYEGDEISCTETALAFGGKRQRAYIHLKKTLGEDGAFGIGNGGEVKESVFGLFAAQDIVVSGETLIPADGLIELLSCDENGLACSAAELPFGEYYLKELASNAHYRCSDARYPVTFTYAGQDEAEVHLYANGGEAIAGEMIRGTIGGMAADQHRYPIPGAQIAVFPSDRTDFTRANALLVAETRPDGRFSFGEIPCGDYVVREIGVPDGYLLNEAMYFVSLTFDGQRVDLRLVSFHKN